MAVSAPDRVVLGDVNMDAKAATTGTYSSSASGKKKRLSVERLYQKKSQHEHILLRPDTYIGSVEEVTQQMWVYDEGVGMVFREVTFVPGLYKIFDEILVNAADNKQRDPRMNQIKVTIDPVNNKISIWNNGRGIPVEMHKEEHMYVPSLIFGHLLTSSNYDDEEQKVTGGRNGYGAKLCNIYSNEFTVETACSESGKKFKQTWRGNMLKAGEPKIGNSSDDYTCISFCPDLSKFKMESLTADTVALMTRRAYDIAGTCRGVKVVFNGQALKMKSFRDYVNLYLQSTKSSNEEEEEEEEKAPADKIVHEVVNDRWEVCVTSSTRGFQQISFVNSIATTKGGSHVGYVADQVVQQVMASVTKKNKGGVAIKPFQIKNHTWVFINCLVVNPTFDSQTKENMTLKAAKFGSKCSFSDGFMKKVLRCGIVEHVLEWARFKSEAQLKGKCHATKHSKLRGVPKLDDANDAGTKHSRDCTLILTEGDSAKALAVSGLSIVGRDRFGVFPLRGKVLNVREASHKQIMENAELTNMVKILGLQYQKDYSKPGALDTLRYGHVMIMTDQDQDGSHIKGLLINFIHFNWPSLLRHPGFLQEFITPIVKASKGKEEHSFYSIPEFSQWVACLESTKAWRIKYYKGLGTSTHREAKEYFAGMDRHRIPFSYTGKADDDSIKMAFSKKLAGERKEWLTNWLQHRRDRRAQGLSESFLYDSKMVSLTYQDFINKELILFSNADNERSIPSLVDGLKPGQRKVLFTCFKRNDKREVKVAQLAGSVAELSAYHHGEASLMGTVINMAQDFVGSNNVNLLLPIGQFGTRLHGGKDAASPRYIFTKLSPVTRRLFPVADEASLRFLSEDNQRIEPEWYCPILPMVLVNGAEGIGTGYSTSIPNFDVRDVIRQMRRMMNGQEPEEIKPMYKDFTGAVAHVQPHRFNIYGRIGYINETQLEITELPIRTWTETYKEAVLRPMLHGTDKVAACIQDYREYHTEATVRFVITLSPANMAAALKEGLYKKFKLESRIGTTNMVLFDSQGCLRRYDNVVSILQEFYELRSDRYRLRKEFLVGQLEAESSKLSSQARFITEKISGKLVMEDKPMKVIIAYLEKNGYPSDPVKHWKDQRRKIEEGDAEVVVDPDDSDSENEGESSSVPAASSGPDYDYLLDMRMRSISREKKEELIRQRDTKNLELAILLKKTPHDLWSEDLAEFEVELVRREAQEQEDAMAGQAVLTAAAKKKSKTVGGGRSAKKTAHSSIACTAPVGDYIEPAIPAFMDEAPIKVGRLKQSKAEGSVTEDTAGDGDDPSEVVMEDGSEVKPVMKPSKAVKKPAASSKPVPVKEKAPAKGRKKKSSQTLGSDDDNSEDEVSDAPMPSFRDRVQRARAPVKYASIVDSDGDNADGGSEAGKGEKDEDDAFDDSDGNYSNASYGIGDDSDDSDFGSKRKPVQKSAASPSKRAPAPRAAVSKPPTSPKKSAAKKQIVSDDDKDAGFAMDKSDDDSTARKKPVRKAAPAKKSAAKKQIVSDDDEDAGFAMDESDDDSTAKKKPVRKAAPAKKSAAKKQIASDDDEDAGFAMDESDDDSTAKKKPAKRAAPAKSAAKKQIVSDDDADVSFAVDESDDDSTAKKKPAKKAAPAKAPARKPAAAKPAAKRRKVVVSGSEDDDVQLIDDASEGSDEDFGLKKKTKKPTAAAKKPAPAKKPAAKAAAKAKPAAVAAGSKGRKRMAVELSDSDDMDNDDTWAKSTVPVTSPMSREKRARQPVKYSFNQSSDEDF